MRTPRQIISEQIVDLLVPRGATITIGEDVARILRALDRAGFQIIVKTDDIPLSEYVS